jgi:hypothetical protein
MQPKTRKADQTKRSRFAMQPYFDIPENKRTKNKHSETDKKISRTMSKPGNKACQQWY